MQTLKKKLVWVINLYGLGSQKFKHFIQLFVFDNECINAVVKHLKEHFEIKIMNVGCFLGMEIEQNDDDSIFAHQAAYIREILSKFNMENCHPIAVPSDSNQNLHSFSDSKLSNYPYRELIGSLMYLSVANWHCKKISKMDQMISDKECCGNSILYFFS